MRARAHITPQRVLGTALAAVAIFAAGAAVWIGSRFEFLSLPREGCTPIRGLQPGARLLVDRSPSLLADGRVVLWRGSDEAVHLGRLAPAPQPIAPDQVWIVVDDPDCPAPQSSSVGPIPRERVAGRVLMTLPW